MELVVTNAFLSYAVGDLITDPATVMIILADYPEDVVKIGGVGAGDGGGGGAPETLNVLSVAALVGLPCQINGNVGNSTLPLGLDWSVDGGKTWTRATNLLLSGASWTCNGPTYITAGHQQTLQVQDPANTAITATAPAFSVAAAAGVDNIAGLSGTVSASALKTALAIGAADVAGLGDAATANFGTVTGSVADGGALTSLTGSVAGIAQVSSANVVAALSAGHLAGVPWSDAAGSAAVFSHGQVPAPPYARSSLQFGDRLKLAGSFNFGETWDTQANYDAYPKLQAFLFYCQSMALAMKNTTWMATASACASPPTCRAAHIWSAKPWSCPNTSICTPTA